MNIHLAKNLGVMTLLVSVGFLLYGKTFYYPWTFDDFPVLVKNTDIRSLRAFWENSYPGRPLRELTFLIDYQFFGLEPAGYHFQNILWHILNATLLFFLALRLGLSRLWAVAAALLFLVHPLNVEVVAQTSHRKDSLALFFVLSSVLLWWRFLLAEKHRYWLFAGAVGTASLALMAKEHAVVVPILWLFLGLLCVPEEKKLCRNSMKLLWGVGLAVLLVGLGRIVYLFLNDEFLREVRAALNKMGDLSSVSVGTYYLTVLKAQALLFCKWIWPFALAPEYTFPVPKDFADPWVVGGVALIAAWCLAVWRAWSRAPAVAFLLVWVLLGWLPTSNYFGHYAYFAADRYLYLPSAGLAILSIMGVLCLRHEKWAGIVCFLLLMGLFLLSSRQVEIWRSPAALNEQILKVNPASQEARIGQAVDAIDAGQYADAITQLKRLVLEYPAYGKIYKNLALALHLEGQLDEAIRYAEMGVRRDPGDAEGFSNLGSYYEMQGQVQKAIPLLQEALRINPRDQRYYNNLGKLYEGIGQFDQAEANYRESIRWLPTYALGHFNLGVVLYQKGQTKEALAAFREASALAPANKDAIYNLGVVAAELGLYDEAEKALARMQPLDPVRARELADEVAKLKAASAGGG